VPSFNDTRTDTGAAIISGDTVGMGAGANEEDAAEADEEGSTAEADEEDANAMSRAFLLLSLMSPAAIFFQRSCTQLPGRLSTSPIAFQSPTRLL
jgi:hypothetical protein